MTENNPTAAEQTAASDNLSVEELFSSVMGVPQDQTPEEEEAPPEEVEAEAEEADEATETEEEATEDDADDSAGIDLESLSEDEVRALAEKLRSKAISRYAELTKRAKTAEEKLAQLQAESTADKPTAKPIEDNPFKDLTSIEAIRAKREELEGVLETTDMLLDENDDIGNDDIINYRGAEFTKRQLKAAQRNARKGLDKLLPAQEAAIREAEQVAQKKQAVEAVFEERFGEVMTDDDFAERHRSTMEHPLIQKASQDPEFEAQAKWLVAHYLRSLMLDEQAQKKPAAKKAQPTVGAVPKIKPPVSPGSVGAPTSKPVGEAKRRASLREQFERSGSPDDLARLLAG